MRKIIKILILLVALAIFAFSSNSYITKARTFTMKNGKTLYEYGINKMKTSDNESLRSMADKIK